MLGVRPVVVVSHGSCRLDRVCLLSSAPAVPVFCVRIWSLPLTPRTAIQYVVFCVMSVEGKATEYQPAPRGNRQRCLAEQCAGAAGRVLGVHADGDGAGQSSIGQVHVRPVALPCSPRRTGRRRPFPGPRWPGAFKREIAEDRVGCRRGRG